MRKDLVKDKWTLGLVESHKARSILETNFTLDEVEIFISYKYEIEYEKNAQIPKKLKIWVENNLQEHPGIFSIPPSLRKTIKEIIEDIKETSRRATLNTPIKEKVLRIASTIEENDRRDGFCYFEEMMYDYYSKDPDFFEIKQKMDNLVKLLFLKKCEYLVKPGLKTPYTVDYGII